MGVKAVILRSQKQWPVRSSTVGMISSPRFIDVPTWRRSGTSAKRGRLVGSVAGMILGRRFGDDLRHNPSLHGPYKSRYSFSAMFSITFRTTKSSSTQACSFMNLPLGVAFQLPVVVFHNEVSLAAHGGSHPVAIRYPLPQQIESQ